MPEEMELMSLVRDIADAEAKRHFKAERTISANAMKALYMAIYGQCYLALLDKGLSDMDILTLPFSDVIHLSMHMAGWKAEEAI
jgi:spore coat protein CotH